MKKQAVEITDINWIEYGKLYNMSGTGADTGNVTHWDPDGTGGCHYTSIPLMDTLGYMGSSFGNKVPFQEAAMEKHSHTEELQLPLDQPICLLIAKACEGAPDAEDVIPVIIRPGYFFVLHREVWHTQAHGLAHDGDCYWMANIYMNEPTVWADIKGGPVEVTCSG